MSRVRPFDPGFDIAARDSPLGFAYGPGVFGPGVAVPRQRGRGRRPAYAVAMDVGRETDRADLVARNLLCTAVAFAARGPAGGPMRSGGHVHAASPGCGSSTPELYEVWAGSAVVLMQEYDTDDPGRCYAVRAEVGDIVVVPPSWAHAAVNADPTRPLIFAAWCVRDCTFDYRGVRAHGGLAWVPRWGAPGQLEWEPNRAYTLEQSLVERQARDYREFGLEVGIPVYRQYVTDPDRLMWLPRPDSVADLWDGFIP